MWTDPRTAESVAQDRVELTGAILSARGWAEFTKPIDRDRCASCVGTSYELGFVEGFNNKIRVIQRHAYGLEEYLRLKVLTCMLPAL